MTYRELYEQGVLALGKAGVEEDKLDARLLLEYVCKTDRTTLLAHPQRPVTSKETEEYEEALQQRMRHVPLQYIMGSTEFMGLPFHVNPNVLIPRQDTETLVEEAMRFLMDGSRLLDIGCGSGCILLSLLHYSNHCTGMAVDISPGALECARENAQLLADTYPQDADLLQRVTFAESDLLSGVDGTFDMILSNPPYIATDVVKTLMPEVKDHEPLSALDGGTGGLDLYEKLIPDSITHLTPGGSLLVEIGYDQGEAVKALFEQSGYIRVEVVKDLAGNDRVVRGIKSQLR
ncbi:MAG: peptide chain release factor N(5)-glutamine methyltransferase [Lachnospiraceae bacterium]|nr:peptide chain release factor N(5)-glutamine methyltransferase [Lachnospiraceae bacterium]